jgi:outer membrane protein TolC
VDRPAFDPAPIDVPAAIRRALSISTDLAMGRKTLEADKATLAYLRDQARPQADLVARYGLVGLGGTEFITTGSGITRQVTGTVPGGFGDALNSLITNRYPTWSASVNISYPLGTNVAAAAAARGRIQTNQMEAQLRQSELQAATDVTSAAINVESSIESVEAAKAAQELAQQTNHAEQAKFEVGVSTNYNVILTQRDLNTAKNSYLQAVLNYRNALVELDRVQQTTLQAANVTIVNTLGLNTYSIGSGCLFAGGYPCS